MTTQILSNQAHRRDAVANVGPNWFAAVMGTGIVATAAVTLPSQVRGQTGFALAVWLLAAALLIILLIVTAADWIALPARARAHLRNPVMSHFYGAPAMALLTVGAGSLLVGKDLIGLRAAIDIDWVLWTAGTAFGLLTAVIVPYLTFTQHNNTADSAFGGWLMPIVPPMVSASTGAMLVPHLASAQARETLIYSCYALFGLSLFASVIIISLVWGRLTQHHLGAAAAVPTLWIVLGPLGQSITAANLLGKVAQPTLPAPYGAATAAFGLLYGLPAWGFAALWITVAAAVTVRTARQGLPFSLTWWSFTFPVGTVVTGTSGLAARTGLPMFRYAAAALYIFLLLTWCTVFIRTLLSTTRGGVQLHHQPCERTAQPNP
jgi:C4-dicarboxylate transporter/malic acid transport protein